MMYHQKLVVSIKSKGKILREFKDTVFLPFGEEYSVLLKNLHSRRALVNVFIDGENAVPGGLVVDPGRTVDLERWIKNGNLSEGNRFKFIERTAAIENGPRGIKLEDGLIRIEYQFELPRPILSVNNTTVNTWPHYPPGVRTPTTGEYPGVTDHFTLLASGVVNQVNVGGALRGVDYSAGESTRVAASAATEATLASMGISNSKGEVHDGAACMDSYVRDVGITVPGSKSTQSFQTTQVGALDPILHSIVLRLVGDLGHNKPVAAPVTVKAKPKCVTCGKQNKATAKFCSQCGTALEIFA